MSRGDSMCINADDTQLCVLVPPDDKGPTDYILKYSLDINAWMSQNFLQLNQGIDEELYAL